MKNNTYYTIDNGAHPFKVVIEDTKVYVYINSGEKKDNKNPLLTFKPLKIFMGKSSDKNPQFDGNSFLFEMNKNKYLFVGESVWSFKSKYEIKKYISDVGNSSVVYPYAIDIKDNIYLISLYDNTIILNNEFNSKNIKKYKGPYEYYYNLYLITNNRGAGKESIVNIADIKSFFIGSDRYTLTYTPDAKNDYNKLVTSSKKNMYVVRNKSTKKELITKKDYINIMKLFESIVGIESIEKIKIYSKKLDYV